ncbi:putative membrane protein DUF2232 [Rhodopseudomonas faecalis]|uniref:Putative membrane protein DUF2232 n=1 Tax=Rhodopseudomonas faecalis TaxID=99655 RepID=A0A318TJS3_9BRAD|nr:DUF2232 domain-containing protein [Rhodopseudomonas faecalis]PYF03388.1 putative membrane protein DUF2232 [Rhodopseudomonas faecalis]
MIFNILINLAAGCASALMFGSLVSGAMISVLLFYLAPLPLMVAALGWGSAGAAIGGLAAALGLGTIFGLPYLAAFLVTIALPAWWLGRLALLGRAAPLAMSPSGGPSTLEWYPVERILLWIAGLATLTTVVMLFTVGGDSNSFTEGLRNSLIKVLSESSSSPRGDIEQLATALAAVAPSAGALMAMMTLTVNLWLAGKITAMSGHLQRPWPDLNALTLPPMTLAALSLAVAGSFLDGLPGIVSRAATAALMMVYALQGLATLHTLTQGSRNRTFILGSSYALCMVFGWPILLAVAFGIAEALFGFRRRFARQPPPRAANDD